MPEQKGHDLYDFMRQISSEMSAEYDRIQKRATEDPGTAGDQGEENWAELLRGWLPRTYQVVTKGRIISQYGETSPQIDVLVLKGSYPQRLFTKKLYLAAGVAAAFECKVTLKASHINEVVDNCVKIKSLYAPRVGTPYKELHAPLFYGLLAHSHSWKSAGSTAEENIEQSLYEADALHVSHPRLQVDLLCVADLAAWTTMKVAFIGPHQVPAWAPGMIALYGRNGCATSSYMGHTRDHHSPEDPQVPHFTPIGTLISHVCQRLGWEEPSLRDLADYYRITNIGGSAKGSLRTWPSSIYSEEIQSMVEAGKLSNGKAWDEWSMGFI